MRMIKKNQKRLMVMSIVLFMICAMALGYAALSSSLKISGTGTISANWDILFTRIEEASKKGATSNESVITDKLTATFDVNIEAPGNFIEYNVTLKNNGNIDAVIESIGGIVEANGEAPRGIQFGIRGIRIGDDLLAGAEKTFVIRAEIPVGETNLPTGTKSLDLKVNVRQKDIDSSGIVTTFKDCFRTNEAGDTITEYLCGEGNTNGYSEILDITVPNEIDGKTITTLGFQSFYNKEIRSVILPSTLTTINGQAFYINFLQTITIPNSVTTIGDHAFTNNRLTEITIPKSVTHLGVSAFRMNQMVGENAFIYHRNSDGTEDKTKLNSYAGANRDHVIIPSQVTTIGNAAFLNIECQTVTLPSQLTTIEYSAFVNNRLQTLVLPATVNNIGYRAFADNQLTQIEFQGANPIVDHAIFANNSQLTANTIKVPNGTLERYKNVTSGPYTPSQVWFGSRDESLLDAFYEAQ